MLRVYAAAHGLTSAQPAVVEVGANEIILRAEPRWICFTQHSASTSEGSSQPFAIAENGEITIGSHTEDMDMAAEQVARTLLLG